MIIEKLQQSLSKSGEEAEHHLQAAMQIEMKPESQIEFKRDFQIEGGKTLGAQRSRVQTALLHLKPEPKASCRI